MKTKLFLAGIIILAAVLRLSAISYVEFKGDEAVNSFIALDIVRNGVIHLTGNISSVGVLNPPAFVYLLCLPYFFTSDPVVASCFVVLINLVALFLCYMFCKRFFSEKAALIATLLFATNPWAVLYSRKIWANNILPFFVIGFFYFLYDAVINGKSRSIIPAFLFLAVSTQLHPSTAYFGVLMIAVLLIYRPRISVTHLSYGIIGALLLYVPYLFYEFTHNFYNLKAFLAFAGNSSQFRADSFVKPFVMATTSGFIRYFSIPVLDWTQIIALSGAVAFSLYNIKQRKYLILLLWFFTPILAMYLSKLPPMNHYFVSVLPVSFILIGIGIDAAGSFLETKSRMFGYAVCALVLVLAGYQASCVVGFNHFIKTNKNIVWMGYGPPLKYRVNEIGTLLRNSDVNPEIIQELLIKGRQPEDINKYDFPATKYIAENINYPAGNPLYETGIGRRFYAKLDFDSAIRAYTRALKINPQYSQAYYYRGNAYVKNGQYQRAIDDYTEAIRLNPAFANAYSNREFVFFMQDNKDLGFSDSQKACSLGNCGLLEMSKGKGNCR